MSSSTNNIFDSEQPLLGGLSFFSEQREVVEEYGRVDEPVSSRLQFEHNQNDPILTDEKIELLKSSLTCISKRTRSQSGLLDWGSTLGPQGNSLNDSDEESDLSTESSDLWQSALDVRESLKNSDVGVGVQPTNTDILRKRKWDPKLHGGLPEAIYQRTLEFGLMQIIHRNKKRFQKQCGQNGKTFEMLLGARSVSKVPESGKRRRVYRRQEKISLSGMISDDINRDPDEYSLGSDLPTLQTAIYEENEVQTLMRTVPNNLQLEDKSDFNYLDEALRRLSREIEFTEVGGNEWKFPGVKQCLKMHQVLGVAFMRRRELSSIKPRGGLLADEMGFGKTVQVLTNIILSRRRIGKNNRPRPSRGPTLIIVPSMLIPQWYKYINDHCEPEYIGDVLQYTGRGSLNTNNNPKIMSQYDVVITSHQQVARSYPKTTPPSPFETYEAAIEWWQKKFEEERGVFHRLQFERVVVDEVHMLRNDMGRLALACRALSTKHFWGISGTPLVNSAKDVITYLKLFEAVDILKYTKDIVMFHKSGDEEEVADLRIFLSRIMLRRTRACRLFGRAIAFPKITSKIIHVRFNDLERSIYDLISDRFIDMIQYPSEEEDADKKSSIVFTMLVRLRQSTCHVLHAIKRMTDIMTPEDILSLKRLADEHADDEHLGSQVDGLRRIGAFLECGNSAAPDFDLSCAGCGVNPAIAPWKSSCSHVYCANCVCNLQFGAPEQPQSRNCTLCGTEVIGLQPIEKEVIAAYEQKRRQTEGEQPKTSQGKHITEEPSETVCPLNSRPWLPSSKTVEIKRQIREWLSTSPEIKIVVFTHFHRVINILAALCEDEGWGALTYHGNMTIKERGSVIETFSSDSDIRIILVSIKCGGVGLNLQMASKVIIVDPWWNKAAEKQAFYRVIRLDQLLDVTVVSVIVEDTIESRMVKMQDKKGAEIDSIIDYSTRPKRKDIPKLLQLLGVEK